MSQGQKGDLNALLSIIFQGTYKENIEGSLSPFLSPDITLEHYRQGQSCIYEGYAAEYFLIGLTGRFHVIKYNHDGKRLFVNPTNQLYGLCEVLGEKRQFNASVVCTTDASCLRITARYLHLLLKEDITLCQTLICFLSDLAYQNMQRGDRIILYTDYENLLFFLSQLGSAHAAFPICTEFTQKNIADILGINLRTLSRYLAKMKTEGKIDIVNGRICLSRQQYQDILEEVNDFT